MTKQNLTLQASQTLQSVANVPSLKQAIKTRGLFPKTTEKRGAKHPFVLFLKDQKI